MSQHQKQSSDNPTANKQEIVPGNAEIAALDPYARPEHERAVPGEERRPKSKSEQESSVAGEARKHQEGKAKPDRVVAQNPIDEAAWESFPASDPPSHGGATSTPSGSESAPKIV